MDRQLHILILEDNAYDAELIQRELRKAGFVFTAQTAADKAAFLQALDALAPDILLADYSLPGFDGISALALTRARFPDVPGIIVSGAIGEETAIEALKAGATDYVLKQRLSRLGPVVRRALQEVQQRQERNRAQAELARQQEWLRVTLTSIGDAVIATDTAGHITFLNPVAIALTGWSQDQALGQPITGVFRIVDEKTREPGVDIVAQVLQDRRVAVLANHTALIARDGREMPVEDSAAPILDAAGKLLGAVLVFHDVTQKRREQETLRESRTLLQTILDGSSDSIYVKDRNSRVLLGNPALARAAGKPIDEIIGRTPGEYFNDPVVGQGLRENDLRVMASGQSAVFEETVPTPAGGRTFLSSKAPFRNATGEIVGIIVVSRDISELKQAQMAVANERANLQTIFDVANVGLLLIDDAGVVKRVNDTVSKWVGRDLSADLGNQPGDIVGCIHALDGLGGCGRTSHCASCRIRQTFETAMRSGQPVHNVETPATLSIDGRDVSLWLEVSADPLVLDDRRHVILALNNITARKQAEETLRQATENLVRSNKELEQFAYVASHDLQEPLRMVTGFTSLLKDYCQGRFDAKAEEYIAFASEGAARMQALIDDLLVYSRVGREKSTTTVDVAVAVKRALENLHAGITESGARIACDVLPAIPSNAMEMTQLFQNLIGNAIKFRQPGVTPEVHIGAKKVIGAKGASLGAVAPSLGADVPSLGAVAPSLGAVAPSLGTDVPPKPADAGSLGTGVPSGGAGAPSLMENVAAQPANDALLYPAGPMTNDLMTNDSFWLFTVRDNGIGIAPEFHGQLFQLFQRLHTRDAYPGTGVGLSICKKIVERYGGRIWVESKLGEGATFCFTLPA